MGSPFFDPPSLRHPFGHMNFLHYREVNLLPKGEVEPHTEL